MKNGVPFDIAFGLPDLLPHEKMAMSITFSEMESGKIFNWQTMDFEERK
jgi:hypothetical protein